jgi:peptidoglycan/xylan/chitin deacetylase (PgdA/CDA1 family)
MSPRTGLKNLFYGLTRAGGVQAVLRWLHRRRLLVLCYHGVVPGRHPGAFAYRNTVATEEFAAQMRHLARAFTPVAAAQVLAALDGGPELPDRAVLVTFDDGYRNNLVHALPVLERWRVPAVVFVTTGHIGRTALLWPTEVELRIQGGSGAVPLPDGTTLPLPVEAADRVLLADRVRRACKQLPGDERAAYLGRLREATPDLSSGVDRELVGFLGWDEVRELHARGVAIGAHTESHPILTCIDEARLDHELGASRRRIEAELGAPCLLLAYPNGGPADFSPAVFAAAARAGYRLAFTLTEGLNARRPANRFAIDRVGVPGHLGMSVFGSRTSGLYSRLARRAAP